jgi:hypothetical protein
MAQKYEKMLGTHIDKSQNFSIFARLKENELNLKYFIKKL